jgi:hypothetical protein
VKKKMNRLRQRIVGSLLVVLLLLGVSVNVASAGWMQCRSDPVVILSNGLVMDISADISVFPWKVTHVDYVLHVPEGVSLVLAIHTPTWLTSIESFTVIDDAPPGEYHTETVVHTTTGSASVTAHTILLNALGIQLDLASAPGVEGQVIHNYVHVP